MLGNIVTQTPQNAYMSRIQDCFSAHVARTYADAVDDIPKHSEASFNGCCKAFYFGSK